MPHKTVQRRRLVYAAVAAAIAAAATFLAVQRDAAEDRDAMAASARSEGAVSPNGRRPFGEEETSRRSKGPTSVEPVAGDSDRGGERNHLLETRVLQYLSELPGFTFTSILSVECGTASCEIAFTGTDPNPEYVDAARDVLNGLYLDPWEDVGLASSSTGTREMAPGARAYVVRFRYVTYEPLSDDLRTAARQYAACAAVRLRVAAQAESNGFEANAAALRREAERYLAIAAGTLGRADAEALAGMISSGPLIRECRWLGSSGGRVAEWVP